MIAESAIGRKKRCDLHGHTVFLPNHKTYSSLRLSSLEFTGFRAYKKQMTGDAFKPFLPEYLLFIMFIIHFYRIYVRMLHAVYFYRIIFVSLNSHFQHRYSAVFPLLRIASMEISANKYSALLIRSHAPAVRIPAAPKIPVLLTGLRGSA